MRKIHVLTIQNFVEEYGRTPNLRELGERLGFKTKGISNSLNRVAHYWGCNPGEGVTYSEAFDNLYRTAGFERSDYRKKKQNRSFRRIGE